MLKYLPCFLATFLSLYFCSFAYSQQVLSGKIVDASNQKPIPGAHLQVRGTSQGTVSDEDGLFSLSPTKEDVIVTISAVGYTKEKVSQRNQVRTSL